MEVLKMADKMGRKRTGRPRLRKTVTRRDVDYLREHMALANRAAFAVASLISEKPAKQTLTVIRKSARDVVDHGYQACARIDGLLYAMDGQLPPELADDVAMRLALAHEINVDPWDLDLVSQRAQARAALARVLKRLQRREDPDE